MIFTSTIFLARFLPVILILAGLAELSSFPKARWTVLFLGSLFFYGFWNIHDLPILLCSICFNYVIGLAIDRAPERRRTRLMIPGAVCNLFLLIYYKYWGFILANLYPVKGALLDRASHIALPLGISFFTFTQIAYLSDVRHGKRGRHGFQEYALFVTFFPHLLAGPIIHHAEMIPQFQKQSRTLSDAVADLAEGGAMIAIGAGKKIMLADQLSPLADLVFGHTSLSAMSPALAWMGALAYTFQIYFDFSGYSDMAVGLARLFGIQFPANFNSPYRSANLIEFWRRWHMTLSRWLRDYLYIPLGGNRGGAPMRYRNLIVTMLLGGLWHGARWNFVIWGGLHGVALAWNHVWAARFPARQAHSNSRFSIAHSISVGVSIAATFLFVVAAWVFFRAATTDSALGILRSMAAIEGDTHAVSAVFWNADGALIGLAALIAFLAPNSNQFGAALASHRKAGLYAACLAGAVACFALLTGQAAPSPPAFLYFNF